MEESFRPLAQLRVSAARADVAGIHVPQRIPRILRSVLFAELYFAVSLARLASLELLNVK